MIGDMKISAPGIALAASLYHDENATPSDTVVLFNSAMGMPRDFYAPLAQFLAQHGIDTLTWDYRGVGDSLNGSVADTPASIHEWGEKDLPAVIDWLRSRYPQRRLVVIAHSVGGQILGMTPKTNLAERIVLIGSQSGYWRLWSGWQQLRIGFIWHFIIPVISRIRGEFPSRWFGFTVNMPNGVAREWARWGRDPEYLMGRHRRASADNYAVIDRPILNIWISDDDIASFDANRKMLSWYSRAQITNRDIHPKDLGVERIGHFRLFRESVGPKFWPQLLEWICP
ncbi:MAG TPA: alpha/beta fold hydrolase [Gammaproteobacteria bacterium]